MEIHKLSTLGEALPKEIERVQELIKLYESVPNGQFAATMMRMDIHAAHKAMIEGDLPGMITAFNDLKGYKE